MSFVIRIAIIAALVLGVYSLYQSPQYHDQLEQAWQDFRSKIGALEAEVNREIGYGSVSTLGPKSVAVRVPDGQAYDWQQVGALGPRILGPVTKNLRVEVDYTVKSKPNSTDLEVIRNVLSQYSGKTVAVYLDTGNITPADNYSLAEIVKLTQDNRRCFSSSTQVCLYFLFLPGQFEGTDALGASFASSAVVIMGGSLTRAANPLTSRNTLAKATLTHELGHLFGLVNLTSRSSFSHEDPDHPGHSSSPDSVMYWAVEDFSVGTILRGGPPVDFDSYDQADILEIKKKGA